MALPLRSLGALALLLALTLVGAPAARAAGPPQITDSWASAVGAFDVTLNAEVNPEGSPTTVKAQYITASAFEANLAASPPREGFSGAASSPVAGKAIGEGTSPVPFANHIGGLAPATAYRYRITATSPEGTTPGPTRTFTTRPAGSGSLSLPDGRAWEMVSPLDKNGGEIGPPESLFGGGLFQAAAATPSITYSSAFSFGGGQGSPGASQYVSSRNSSGWATENVTTPTQAGAFGTEPDGVPFQLFSGELGKGLVFDPQRCEAAPCPKRFLFRQSSNGALTPSPEANDLAFAGASPNLEHVVLSSCEALTTDATEVPGGGDPCEAAQQNLYEWSGGGLTLINLLPGDTQGTPGATLGAQSGAVSEDGSRVYFSQGGNLYLRKGNQTVQVDEALGGGGAFETATADGATAFFSKAEHLYRYAVSTGVATDLTPAGGEQGVLGISPDASYVYYLTSAGLFLNHNATTTKVANGADASDYPPASGTARVASNGNLAFLSAQNLTEADGGALSQAYLYAPATQKLTCVSCNPFGARPLGPSSFPGAVANGALPGATRAYKPRVLSTDGNRLFFESADALVGSDANGAPDVYEWEASGVGSCTQAGGCIGLISSGRSEEGASFLDASADGSDAFFISSDSIVSGDPGASDVYDARVGGGFPEAAKPIVCKADACQVLPGEPSDPASGTGFYRPEGNPALVYPKQKKHKGHKHKKGHHKHHKGKKHGHKQGGRS